MQRFLLLLLSLLLLLVMMMMLPPFDRNRCELVSVIIITIIVRRLWWRRRMHRLHSLPHSFSLCCRRRRRRRRCCWCCRCWVTNNKIQRTSMWWCPELGVVILILSLGSSLSSPFAHSLSRFVRLVIGNDNTREPVCNCMRRMRVRKDDERTSQQENPIDRDCNSYSLPYCCCCCCCCWTMSLIKSNVCSSCK